MHLEIALIVSSMVAVGVTMAGDDLNVPDEATAGRLAALALDCVHREYPNKIAHVLQADSDALPPRKLTPTFFGCFDWHSAVHGHWLLARLARLHPDGSFTLAARAALERSLSTENIAGELRYLSGEGRNTFQRPYGLAWLLQLAAELREWDDEDAQRWSMALRPLEAQAAKRLHAWLPKLSYPIRTGTHGQTAFAFGLVLDWARSAGAAEMERLVVGRTRALYLADRDCPLNYEPSGQDFLSPCLAQADLLRRVLGPSDYAAWLGAFLPRIPRDGAADWLAVAVVSDPTDGQIVHLDGLNLSRAWMLDGIASGLPDDDPRRASLAAARAFHQQAGIRAVTGEHYEGGHWLGSFATYLLTRRGIGQ